MGGVGLESGVDYLRGCFFQQFDLALQRDFNQSHITGRNTTMTVASNSDATIQNLPFDSAGQLIAARSQPRTAGFGMVNGYQGARTLQAWLRFTF